MCLREMVQEVASPAPAGRQNSGSGMQLLKAFLCMAELVTAKQRGKEIPQASLTVSEGMLC